MLSFHNPNLKSTWFAYCSLWLLQLIPTINESSLGFRVGNIFSLPFAWNKTVLWIRANLNSLHNFLGLWPELFPPCTFSQLKNCNFSSQWSTNENLFSSKVCKPKCLPESPGILQGRLFLLKKKIILAIIHMHNGGLTSHLLHEIFKFLFL
jgi:hypothetical protein